MTRVTPLVGDWLAWGRTASRLLRVGVRRLGLRATLARLARGALRPHRFVLLGRGLEVAPAPRPPSGFDLALWERERLAAWRRGRAGLPLEFFLDEIHGVRRCAVVELAGAPVGLIWVYEPGAPSRFFRLAPGDVELNYGYVLPPFRRRGAFTALLSFACRALADHGHRRAFAAVHAANAVSLRAFQAAGFRPLVVVRRFVFGPRVDSTRLAA